MKELRRQEKKFIKLHKIVSILMCITFLTAIGLNSEILLFPILLLFVITGLCKLRLHRVQTKIKNGLGHDDEEHF